MGRCSRSTMDSAELCVKQGGCALHGASLAGRPLRYCRANHMWLGSIRLASMRGCVYHVWYTRRSLSTNLSRALAHARVWV